MCSWVVCSEGQIVVSFKPVLWSPVGAPAGVPGPRRNADDCDAGWFAPVATRRRPIFGAFQAPSPWLAVSPGGTTPRSPPMGRQPQSAFSYGPVSGRRPRGPEGRFGLPEPVSRLASFRPEAPSRFFPLAASGSPLPACVRTALSQVKRLQHSHGRALRALQPAAGRLCPPKSERSGGREAA